MSGTESRTRIRITQGGSTVLKSLLGRELSVTQAALEAPGLSSDGERGLRQYKREVTTLISEVDRARAQMGWNDARG